MPVDHRPSDDDRLGYERELVRWLRAQLMPRTLQDRRTLGTVTVEDVRVEGGFPDSRLVVVVRLSTRPHCRFGFRARIWTDEGVSRGAANDFPDADDFAMILGAHLEETVMAWPGLPSECAPDGITWVRANPMWQLWE
jgi:hypothetical protein